MKDLMGGLEDMIGWRRVRAFDMAHFAARQQDRSVAF
jgi:hypothetical protein